MIEHLSQQDQTWLARFFASPNELTWPSLLDGSAPRREADQVRQWLGFLDARPSAPLILPFMRGGTVTGWYATTQQSSGGYKLGDELNAWLGPTWLSRFEHVADQDSDPFAAVLADRFQGIVYRFTGADAAAIHSIADLLSDYASVLSRKPLTTRRRVRPIGAIRSDFERALIAGDEDQAEAMIAELKLSGRLNEENLRYLEVRLSAGLGLWPQIARDHWLIKTLADLALPPQVLADLIEALYRTYVDDAEMAGDAAGIREAFAREIATPYPKLFASRRGIRTPRILKAFALYEQLQAKPDPGIIDGLLEQLPADSDTTLFDAPPVSDASPPADTSLDEADEAFDDGQFDRAFEFYLRLTPSKKTVSRLVSCVGTIGTDDAKDRLLELLASAEPSLLMALAPAVTTKIESFRSFKSVAAPDVPEAAIEVNGVDPWMRWAKHLQIGQNLADAERAVQTAATAWDASRIRGNSQFARAFAEILGGLNGDASLVARSAVPQIYVSFFPEDAPIAPAAKPIASLLFLLIAMDDKLSRTDLDILGQLTAILIEQGLSPDEYVALMDDLTDVQKRIGSYSYLPWSLDVSEVLATLPCPTDAAREARLRFFLQILGQASGFAHRLVVTDLIPIETLGRDYGVGDEAVAALKRDVSQDAAAEASLPDLQGKTIGIYTLAEAAGSRAKAALERLFPGCKVVVNSDLVATAKLANLAKVADLFVFAWKSSSHQAFYCVKEALGKGEPIWAPGKGTASILRAVLDQPLR